MKRPFALGLALLPLCLIATAGSAQAGRPPPALGAVTSGPRSAIVSLPVPGFGDAVVSLPLGARGPKPVLVVTHGNHDNPESHCKMWREIVQNRGFVLCPRGTKRTDGDSFTHGKELPSEVDADVTALRARYGALVDPGPMMYSGFSQGAFLGTAVVMRSPSRFNRIVMIEGGGGWDARRFANAGGQRVLFACGQASCEKSARAAAAGLERAHVASKVVYAPGAGHTYGGSVGEAIKGQWSWLVAGDPRWSGS